MGILISLFYFFFFVVFLLLFIELAHLFGVAFVVPLGYDAGSSGNPAESCICGTSSPDVESPSAMTSVSNTIVVAVVVILIVLVALAIVVLLIGCVFLYNKKVNLEKAYNISSHASHGSLHRCASRTSCSSHGSRRSARSYKSSSSRYRH